MVGLYTFYKENVDKWHLFFELQLAGHAVFDYTAVHIVQIA
jgi:hypothetical protein